MKRIVIVVFATLTCATVVFLFIFKETFMSTPPQRVTAKTIIPINTSREASSSTKDEWYSSIDETKEQALLYLEHDETFLQAISFDLDKDGISDQICAIRKATEMDVLLLPGIQNPLTNEFFRLDPLQTGITQAKTLVLYSLDLIGDRNNVIIISGMNSENQQILQAFVPTLDSENMIQLEPIVNLLADGSISIQETQRSDAYNLGLTQGKSFPIHAYYSDPTAPETLDQIEKIYNWDPKLKRYTQTDESKVPGKRIETRLLHELQTGNLESFEQFLDGLWYIRSSEKSTVKNIFFDFQNKEIIFHDTNTEEIFTTETSSPRRYGAYFTSRNTSISNIRRLLDIELVGIDEIKLKVIEDVNLKITVASEWDGFYKKRSNVRTPTISDIEIKNNKILTFLKERTGVWLGSDGTSLRIQENNYTFIQNNIEETGFYALLAINDNSIIQFKPEKYNKNSSFYVIDIDESSKESPQIQLTEVKIAVPNVHKTGSQTIQLQIEDITSN